MEKWITFTLQIGNKHITILAQDESILLWWNSEIDFNTNASKINVFDEFENY